VESNVEILPTLNRILGFLQTMEGDKGMPKQDKLAETNIINSSIGNREASKNTLSSQEKNKTTEFAKIFSNVFVEIQNAKKPDVAEKTIVGSIAKSQTKATTPISQKPKEEMSLLSGLGTGLMLIVGGIAALVSGLMNDGPFRGALKILSRIGIEGGIAILKRVVSTVFTLLKELPEKLFGKLGGKFTKFIGEFSGGLGGKVLAKLEKGFLGKMAVKVLKPLSKVLTKIPLIGTLISLGFAYIRFKDGDIVGGVIDTVSALVGLLSLVPGAAAFVIPIQLGLDALNAFLDYKSDQGEGKPKLSKLDILGDMVKSIGSFLWENAKDIPLLGTFKYLGMSWDSFKSGNLNEALKYLAYGIVAIIPGGGLIIRGIDTLMAYLNPDAKPEEPNLNIAAAASSISSWAKSIGDWIWSNGEKIPIISSFKYLSKAWDSFSSGDILKGLEYVARSIPGMDMLIQGYNMLSSLFSTTESTDTSIGNTNTNWIDKVKDFVRSKMKDLPMVLRKPLEWLGIVSEDAASAIQTSTMVSNLKDSVSSGFEKSKNFFKNVWSGISSTVSTKVEQIKSFASGTLDSLKPAIEAPVNNAQAIQNGNDKVGQRMANISSVQTERLGLMISLSQKHLTALNNLITIGNMSLNELKRMNSSAQTVNVPSIPNISELPTKDMIPFEDNRDGYFSSVYRLAP
jgi:hypothetical protein